MPNSILVVDDERDFTDLTAYHLRHKGYKVTVAHDGESALDEARRRLPDLILLDLMLPEIDGFTVCELLRHHAPTRAIPILLLTALTGELTRLQALAVGADQFLTKPIRLAELAHRVEQTLRLRGTLSQPRGGGGYPQDVRWSLRRKIAQLSPGRRDFVTRLGCHGPRSTT